MSSLKLSLRAVLRHATDWKLLLVSNLVMLFGLPLLVRLIAPTLVPDVAFALFLLAAMPVGMTSQLPIMIAAVVIAVIFMMVSSGAISNFVHRHPTIKILALSFLILIGVTLIAEGLDQHISKGYIYFAMAFSVFVEMLNLRMRGPKAAPVELRETYSKERAKLRK